MNDTTLSLSFNPHHAKKLFQTIVAFEVCLVILYLMDHLLLSFGEPHQMIDLDKEMNFPSWFSSVQLFFIGFFLLLQLFKIPKVEHFPISFICIIALGFIFLSLDESISFHENLTFKFVSVEWLPRFKNNHGLWIPIYLAMIVTFLFSSRKLIVDLWKHYRKELIIFSTGMISFLIGGVVLEIISYEYLRFNESSKAYLLEVAMEEGLEMIGASFMLYASLLLALH
ncbi:MAG: hypothetical protein V4545_03490 [Pseudomonadota bacterium]